MRLLFAAAIAAALTACARDPDPPPTTPRAPGSRAQSSTDQRDPASIDSPLALERPFVGVVAAAESADIVPRFPGVVAAVHVRPGDRVAAGQVIAELDPGPLREELRAAEAAAARAGAEARKAAVDVEDARRKLALAKRAAAAGLSPATELDEARLEVERARAAQQAASQEAKVALSHASTARAHLAQTSLSSPFDGTVALRMRDAGATVDATTPIAKIVKRGQLRLRFAVPVQRARTLTPGTPVTAAVDTIESPVAATIRHISPALDPASELIIVEAELAVGPDLAAELRPGLAAAVMLSGPVARR
jgi:RND family efflux transporter MFP subunit